MLSPQWLDQLRSRLSLSALIGRSTRLIRAGREFKACCPFHEEKTPSFTVNDDKGFYHCFGCGAHGDAIRWMTDQRGLSFIDAVRELAAEAGMELPALEPKAARQAEQRQGLHDVTAAAQAWFVAQLASTEGEVARRYLAGRGFPGEIVERFGFGYALPGRQGLRRALAQFPDELLIEAGLRIVVAGKEPYDRFRDRLMLPIRDPRGRVIGFGGRILDSGASDAPKYLNSPDTPLFDKGRTLFNLNRAGPTARKSGRLVVVEGYMDVVALAAAGIEEAVAPLGTALTEAQIELLWRVCEQPVLCFDGDAAGQRAANRAMLRALPLLHPGHSLAFVALPAGLDPDDIVRTGGGEAMRKLLESPRPLVDALWEAERDRQSVSTPEELGGLRERLLGQAEQIKDVRLRREFERRFDERLREFGRALSRLRNRKLRQRTAQQWIDDSITRANAPRLRSRTEFGGEQDSLLAAVTAGLLRHPSQIARHADSLARLTTASRSLARLIDLLIDLADSGQTLEADSIGPILAARQLAAPSPREHAGIRFAFLTTDADPALAAEELADAVAMLLERPALKSAKAAAAARFAEDPEGATAEMKRLLERELVFEQRMRQRATARAGAEREVNGRDGGQ